MSRITLTELAKKRLMGDGLPAEVRPNGDVFVPYDTIKVSHGKGAAVYFDMYLGKDKIASFEERLLFDETLTISGIEGKLRVHAGHPVLFERLWQKL